MSPRCNCTKKSLVLSEVRKPDVKIGRFYRASDDVWVQRFRCQFCFKTYSEATSSDCFGQKKRYLNHPIFVWLASGMSQRRLALNLRINCKTVVRKFRLMGARATELLPIMNAFYPPAKTVEFDDLESFTHTKCKPNSTILMVEFKTRRILGFRVAQMAAKGRLTHIAKLRYGKRIDKRRPARHELFLEMKPLIIPKALIKSDENPHYPKDVANFFKEAQHKTTKGRRGCVVGQGELKRGGFDPIFSLNHTCAMFRANINRLIRKTWCTTKIEKYLGYHIALYAIYHNEVWLKRKKGKKPRVVFEPEQLKELEQFQNILIG